MNFDTAVFKNLSYKDKKCVLAKLALMVLDEADMLEKEMIAKYPWRKVAANELDFLAAADKVVEAWNQQYDDYIGNE